MAYVNFKNIKITGISGVVPKNIMDNLKAHPDLTDSEKEKKIKLTGISKYRKAEVGVCASDLCQKAAEVLFNDLDISPSTVDAVLFVSQTSDYRMPSTACILQDKLSCKQTTVAFDINLGCSGFVYGLYVACSLVQSGGINRALLLCGDTQTKLYCKDDKNLNFLMGDAGTATIVDSDGTDDEIKMALMTDGSRYDKLIIPAGGFRLPSEASTRKVNQQADGSLRSQEHLYMDGMEVFNFTVTDVVRTISGFMEKEDIQVDDTDYLFLHQANKFMTDKIARKLGFPLEKVPYSLGEFGNTSCASIPLTVAHHFSSMQHIGKMHCLFSGFGVGLSWGVIDIMLMNMCCPPIGEL